MKETTEEDECEVMVTGLSSKVGRTPPHLVLAQLSQFGEVVYFSRDVRQGGKKLCREAQVRFLTADMKEKCVHAE